MDYVLLIIGIVLLIEVTLLVTRRVLPTRTAKRKIFVDTSALIDGRIVAVAKSGFLDGDLIITKSVLRELQLLADGKDSEKRMRARAGLEKVAELERVVEVNTEILDDSNMADKVDDALLLLARENRGAILTLDYNLIKVAEAENIDTLNINDLSLATRTEFIPGEKARIKIFEKGSGRGQGIGHLENGAMVVVEKAANKVGKEVMVEFERLHETPAGRIIFAKIIKR